MTRKRNLGAGRMGDPAAWAKYDEHVAAVRASLADREPTRMSDAQRGQLHELFERDERQTVERIEEWLRGDPRRDHRSGLYGPGDKAPTLELIEVHPAGPHRRTVRLRPASDVRIRRTRWLWDGRLPLGSIALTAGREGTGKSLMSLDLAADVTRGTLDGEYRGTPKGVIIVTTEDSWTMTIAPRLRAAGADMTRIFRTEVTTAAGVETGLSLPHDLDELQRNAVEQDVALVILDPLLSRLDASLDTHKDSEVRQALEPLAAVAERTKVTIVGLIHLNKTTTADPLTAIMASRAFAAVARAVLFVMEDPDDKAVRLVGNPKNNLGRTNLPTLRFTIEETVVGEDPDDGLPVKAPRIAWQGTSATSIHDALANILAGPKVKSKRAEAEEWLVEYLQARPDGREASAKVREAAEAAGIGDQPLRRAREHAGILVEQAGFPRQTYWQLPTRLMPEPDEG